MSVTNNIQAPTTDSSKSANQHWKESGTTLPFKEWIEREKAKNKFLIDKRLNEEGEKILNDLKQFNEKNDYRTNSSGTILGINKYVFALFSVATAAGIVYIIAKKGKVKLLKPTS